MKRILALVGQIALVGVLILSTFGCCNFLADDKNSATDSQDVIVRDIAYYQTLIKVTEAYINDCQDILNEIQANQDCYHDEKEFQSALDEVIAQRYVYQSEVNQYQYHILLLESNDGQFSFEQILQGINIFTSKITNLEQQLWLKEKYSDYYSKEELQVIRYDIKRANEILAIFLKLKENQENEIIFIIFINFSRC